jgi:hypothetical protein
MAALKAQADVLLHRLHSLRTTRCRGRGVGGACARPCCAAEAPPAKQTGSGWLPGHKRFLCQLPLWFYWFTYASSRSDSIAI